MSPTAWIARYEDAWRTKDDAALAELFTPDASYLSSPTGEAHVGREAIAAYWRSATGTQQDFRIRTGRPVVAGNRAVVEWWATMRDPDWRPDAASDRVTLPGCLVLTFADDGLCRSLREYYNPVFGETHEPPPGWGE